MFLDSLSYSSFWHPDYIILFEFKISNLLIPCGIWIFSQKLKYEHYLHHLWIWSDSTCSAWLVQQTWWLWPSWKHQRWCGGRSRLPPEVESSRGWRFLWIMNRNFRTVLKGNTKLEIFFLLKKQEWCNLASVCAPIINSLSPNAWKYLCLPW